MSAATNPLIVPLSALAEVNPPRLTTSLQARDEVSFIPMGDVSESGRWTGRQLREYAAVRNGFTCFADGDVLFAKITPCMENGKGCIVTGLAHSIGFGSTEFHVLRARPEADAGYVYQWSIYSALRQTARNSMTGSAGQQRVPTDFFDKFCVPKFSKPEQTKIAEILSTVDRAIEQTEALIAKQQRLKTGLMQDLLTRGIDEHGNLRSEQTHEFKDSPLGRIPVEWEVLPLSQLVDELITYGIVQAGPNIEDGVPYIRTGDMCGEEIDLDRLLRTSLKIAKSYKRSEVRVGDIVFALRATVGKVMSIHHALDGANLTQGTAKISPKASVDGSFLIQAMRMDMVLDQIRLCEKGTTFMEISLTDLRGILVAIPQQTPEQVSIAAKLQRADEVKSQYLKSVQKLRALKTALMQDLLTGRRRVTAMLDGEDFPV